MPEQTTSFLKQLFGSGLGYLWFVFLAAWGGTVNYITRKKSDKSPFSVVELIGEWVISGFSGLITAFICQEMQMPFMYTAAACGVAGHMGGRGIFLIEVFLKKRIGIAGGK